MCQCAIAGRSGLAPFAGGRVSRAHARLATSQSRTAQFLGGVDYLTRFGAAARPAPAAFVGCMPTPIPSTIEGLYCPSPAASRRRLPSARPTGERARTPFAPPLRTGGLDARGRAGSAAVAVEGVAASERAQPCRANECAARPSTCDCRQTLPTQSSMMCWQSGPRAPRGHRRCPLAATVV